MQSLIIALTVWIVCSNMVNAPEQKELEKKRATKIAQINMLMDKMIEDGVAWEDKE